MSRLQFFKVYSRSLQYLNHNTQHQLVTSATSLPHHCYQPGHQQTFESKSHKPLIGKRHVQHHLVAKTLPRENPQKYGINIKNGSSSKKKIMIVYQHEAGRKLP